MWFLLSLNLSHWIGSFSTVGLDSHLGFRQKGLREAFHFSFLRGEGRRDSWRREKGTNSKTELEEIFSGHENRGDKLLARVSRWRYGTFIAGTHFETVKYGQHLLCTEIKKGTASFIAGTFFKILRWNLGWR